MKMNDKESSSPQQTPTPTQPLPVIIAGAGPCGLVAALTLQQQGVPFVLYERASRAKLCSNTGSGIDVAPTAVDILANKLHIDMSTAMRPYDSMYIGSTKGDKDTRRRRRRRPYSTYKLQDLPNAQDFGFSNRSELQKSLLASVTEGLLKQKGPNQELNSIVRCNTEIVKYENQDDHVSVTIRTRDDLTRTKKTESTVKGSVLLACDGIHSAVRKHLHRHTKDDYNYIGQDVWWGKTDILPGSELDVELQKLQEEESLTGSMATSFLGSPKNPGGFFSCNVSEQTQAWVYFTKHRKEEGDVAAPNQSNDLVRRGGTVLTEDMKYRDLVEPFQNKNDRCRINKILQLFIRDTVASDITRAGLFDRKHLDLPYVDGRVALLGDAAHPQSPMMGQGANMAIVDGYIVGRRLAAAFAATTNNNNNDHDNNGDDDAAAAAVLQALSDFDCDIRRKGVNTVIKQARFVGKLAVTQNRVKDWLLKASLKYSPPSLIIKQLVSGDMSNKVFVDTMERDLNLEKKKQNNPTTTKSDQETTSSVSS